MQGAGGCNFGIVTSVVVQTYSDPGKVTYFDIHWSDSKNRQALAWFQVNGPARHFKATKTYVIHKACVPLLSYFD